MEPFSCRLDPSRRAPLRCYDLAGKITGVVSVGCTEETVITKHRVYSPGSRGPVFFSLGWRKSFRSEGRAVEGVCARGEGYKIPKKQCESENTVKWSPRYSHRRTHPTGMCSRTKLSTHRMLQTVPQLGPAQCISHTKVVGAGPGKLSRGNSNGLWPNRNTPKFSATRTHQRNLRSLLGAQRSVPDGTRGSPASLTLIRNPNSCFRTVFW